MNNCKIVQDLIPLVKDGVSSEESKEFVREHCERCRECTEVLNMGQILQMEPEFPNDAKIIKNIKKKLAFSKALFMGLGILIAALAWGLWGKLSGNLTGNEIAFALIIFYFIAPVTSFVVTMTLSIKGSFWKWFFPVVAYACTASASLIMFHHAGGGMSVAVSVIPALLGLGVGLLVRKFRKSRSVRFLDNEK